MHICICIYNFNMHSVGNVLSHRCSWRRIIKWHVQFINRWICIKASSIQSQIIDNRYRGAACNHIVNRRRVVTEVRLVGAEIGVVTMRPNELWSGCREGQMMSIMFAHMPLKTELTVAHDAAWQTRRSCAKFSNMTCLKSSKIALSVESRLNPHALQQTDIREWVEYLSRDAGFMKSRYHQLLRLSTYPLSSPAILDTAAPRWWLTWAMMLSVCHLSSSLCSPAAATLIGLHHGVY